MKHLLLLLCCVFGALATQAQFNSPVKWTFKMEEDTIPNQYIVMAKATLDSGWHIFTNEPGGDGLLMPTEFVIDADSAITDISPIELLGTVIQKEIDGTGLVNYFEKEARFKRIVTLKEKIPLTGSMHFQICNDEMCLPPTEELFLIKP
ncbi:MAG: protein-disulfide reductase DsbD domain-containing protein [Chitinophagaceae bacterium]